MKKKYSKAKDRVKGLFRPRSDQSTLTTPSRSPGISHELSATNDPDISNTTGFIALASQGVIAPQANATPGGDVLALEASAPVPSPQSEHTSNIEEAYTKPHFEPSTHVIIGSIEMQVAETTQDVDKVGTQRQEADEAMRMTRREKAITTGQALLSPCSFRRITHAL